MMYGYDCLFGIEIPKCLQPEENVSSQNGLPDVLCSPAWVVLFVSLFVCFLVFNFAISKICSSECSKQKKSVFKKKKKVLKTLIFLFFVCVCLTGWPL